ncbi:MAG: CcoQ/FixQ family Cbb3-type cytochrome c oxidase assembly chaperone [Arenimonas sp.]|nr:CcoQ/FixQ family Cbb3-type cytochrome c oxidase assembly chaperone [Arenimonas sp.]MBP6309830.1 CcoQ/FixQ family Cbb3-type cytochrome c oxidase assembly chaperone [Arenimonas sp.]
MLSGIISLTLLVLFIAGSIWAYSPKRKAEFDEAARLAVDDISEKSK